MSRVRNEAFKELMNELRPDWVLPSTETLRSLQREKALEMKKILKDLIHTSNPFSGTLTSDGWKSSGKPLLLWSLMFTSKFELLFSAFTLYWSRILPKRKCPPWSCQENTPDRWWFSGSDQAYLGWLGDVDSVQLACWEKVLLQQGFLLTPLDG